MSVREGADDAKRIVCGKERCSPEGAADQLDDVIGEVGDVAEGLVLDFSAFAEGAAQEVRDVYLAPLPIPDGGYMYGAISACQSVIIYLYSPMSTQIPTNYWLHYENHSPYPSLLRSRV